MFDRIGFTDRGTPFPVENLRQPPPMILIWLVGMVSLLGGSINLGAVEKIPPNALWDLQRLSQAPKAQWGKKEGFVQEVYYQGEPFQGKPTRVFAYVGRPEGQGPFPGIVLVHGGGGQAFHKWAEHWAKRGYVSIAMDTAGNGPGRKRLDDGGPDQADNVKFQNFDESSIRDMWTYHAVADVILAHSLLRSLPDVDPRRTALTGISWGGYLTCITAGVDSRFKAAVPVYGCGFLHDNSVWAGGSLARLDEKSQRLWIRYFDPGQHVSRTTCPIMFFNGTNDFAYPLDSYRKTIEQVKPELATIAIQHRLKHGHIWTFEIVDAFIDSILREKRKLAQIGELRIVADQAQAEILTDTKVASAELWYTTDRVPWQQRNWKSIAGKVTDSGISAELPEERPITFFLQAIDERGLRTSSTHAELEGDVKEALNHAAVPTPKLEQDFYDWHQRHAEILRIKHQVDPEIVLIGDSITHMWGGVPKEPKFARGAKSWDALFGTRALNLGFGWDRTQNVLWRIDHGELDGINPKLVVIHVGTNNLTGTKNHEACTPHQIAEGIRAVGHRVRSRLPDATIKLMAIFPRGETPDHAMRKPILKINEQLPAVAKEIGAELVDITDKLLDERGIYPKELAADSLHPSAQGYEVWAQALRPFVRVLPR